MNPSTVAPPTPSAMDADQEEQCRPGYGIPSQDPRPAAQMPLRPEEVEREARSALAGGGVMAGAAAGALIGAAVAGPVGVVVGGTVGAVAGALGGAAVGAGMTLESSVDTDSKPTPENPGSAAAPPPGAPWPRAD